MTHGPLPPVDDDYGRVDAQLRKAEILFWLGLVIISFLEPLYLFSQGLRFDLIFTVSLWPYFGVTILIFLSLYTLIFGELPLTFLRRRYTSTRYIRVSVDHPSAEDTERTIALKLLSGYAESSRKLSTTLFTRSGVYLMVGAVVSFAGLAFFYFQTQSLAGYDIVSLDTAIIYMAIVMPKFGIMVFIELVAFFFLRQYRSAMDEFRHYESIQRKREETLALLRLAPEFKDDFKLSDLVRNDFFFSSAGRLRKDETTEIIEFRKLEKNEIDILEKIVELIGKQKFAGGK
jgi:hypothetical protein